MCPEWLNSFEAFLKDMGLAGAGRTLDRLDGQQGYSPDNCRWSTKEQQSANVAGNAFLLKNVRVVGLQKGEKKPSPAEILKQMGISFQEAQSGICGCGRRCFYDEKFCGCADCENDETKSRWKPFVETKAPEPVDVWN